MTQLSHCPTHCHHSQAYDTTELLSMTCHYTQAYKDTAELLSKTAITDYTQATAHQSMVHILLYLSLASPEIYSIFSIPSAIHLSQLRINGVKRLQKGNIPRPTSPSVLLPLRPLFVSDWWDPCSDTNTSVGCIAYYLARLQFHNSLTCFDFLFRYILVPIAKDIFGWSVKCMWDVYDITIHDFPCAITTTRVDKTFIIIIIALILLPNSSNQVYIW